MARSQKEIFASNLKHLLDIHDLAQVDVAKAIGVSPQTFNTWVKGVAIPRMGKIQALADYFGVLKSELVDDNPPSLAEPQDRYFSSAGYVRIPVLGEIAGGIPIEAIEIRDDDDWEDIPQEWLNGGREYLALRVQGDSMEPRIHSGDVAIVKKQPVCDSGDICAVYVNGYAATLKKILKIPDGSIVLQSTNPNYEPKVYTADQQEALPVVILGKLVELRAKF